MLPGDMLEWFYMSNSKTVDADEQLWSSTMKRWVPIGHPALLVHIDEETYTWLSPEGLFHARVDDMQAQTARGRRAPVVPRVCK